MAPRWICAGIRREVVVLANAASPPSPFTFPLRSFFARVAPRRGLDPGCGVRGQRGHRRRGIGRGRRIHRHHDEHDGHHDDDHDADGASVPVARRLSGGDLRVLHGHVQHRVRVQPAVSDRADLRRLRHFELPFVRGLQIGLRAGPTRPVRRPRRLRERRSLPLLRSCPPLRPRLQRDGGVRRSEPRLPDVRHRGVPDLPGLHGCLSAPHDVTRRAARSLPGAPIW